MSERSDDVQFQSVHVPFFNTPRLSAIGVPVAESMSNVALEDARRALPILLATLLLLGAIGCASTSRVSSPRTAWEQILSTEAIDRAMAQLEWPELPGRTVFVSLGAPYEGATAPSDREYLQRNIQVALADRGALIVTEFDQAELTLTVLVGAVGLDIGERFFGFKGTAGGFIPITIPELALFKRTRREGFAKTEIALVDHKNGAVIHRSGPVQGSAFRTTRTYLLVFRTLETDTGRLD